ncbi:MAG: tRNA 2-thiouridine(34) synthase MnmA [Verrucomicrobiota bacterium]
MPAREKILVAMSGGVDSSVAALLLKAQGHELVGAYMKNWINEDNIVGQCPWEQDIADARAVCERLGLEFRVVNLMRDYRERIVAHLLDGYARGLTPNPDVMCNREIKFGVFLAWAKDHGFDAVATGHYAQRIKVERDVPGALLNAPGGRVPPQFALLEGADQNKDQSYFLALLSQAQLADARFPLGELTKPQVRALGREAGLPNADKKDSQGICFIGEVKMRDFLRQYVPDAPGPIVHAGDGRVLGEHRGLHFYTLGQRKGIGIPSNTDHAAYVVTGKRAADRALLVAFDAPDAPGLFQTEVQVHSLQWNAPPVTAPCALEGRVRYRDPRGALEFLPGPNHTARIRFREPQRALASGQILALHDGERLLGGGIYL